MKEWHNRKHKTQFTITAAVTLLIAAVLMLAYGNYIGGSAPKKKSNQTILEQKSATLKEAVIQEKGVSVQKIQIEQEKIPSTEKIIEKKNISVPKTEKQSE